MVSTSQKAYLNWTSRLELLRYDRWYNLLELWPIVVKIRTEIYKECDNMVMDYFLKVLKSVEILDLFSETIRFPASGVYFSEFLNDKDLGRYMQLLKFHIRIYDISGTIQSLNGIYDMLQNNYQLQSIRLFNRSSVEAEFGLIPTNTSI